VRRWTRIVWIKPDQLIVGQLVCLPSGVVACLDSLPRHLSGANQLLAERGETRVLCEPSQRTREIDHDDADNFFRMRRSAQTIKYRSDVRSFHQAAFSLTTPARSPPSPAGSFFVCPPVTDLLVVTSTTADVGVHV